MFVRVVEGGGSRDLFGGNRSETVCTWNQNGGGRKLKIWGSGYSENTWLLFWYSLHGLPFKFGVGVCVAALTFEMLLVSLQLRGQ